MIFLNRKGIRTSLLGIVFSLPLGLLIGVILYFFNAVPPVSIVIDRVNLYPFSFLILGDLFVSIINSASFFRLRVEFRKIDFDSEGVLGALFSAVASIFSFLANLELSLASILSLSGIGIIVLTWIAFVIFSLVFYASGSIHLGLSIFKLGKKYDNKILKSVGLLLISVILSYFGYLLLYLNLSKLTEKKGKEMTLPAYLSHEATMSNRKELEEVTRKMLSNYEKTVFFNTLREETVKFLSEEPPPPFVECKFEVIGPAVLRKDGSLSLNVFTSDTCYILSARIETLPYAPEKIEPNVLPIGYQKLYIKFNQIVVLGLYPYKTYKLYLALRTSHYYLPDKEIPVVYRP